jgi:hypothetical protein
MKFLKQLTILGLVAVFAVNLLVPPASEAVKSALDKALPIEAAAVASARERGQDYTVSANGTYNLAAAGSVNASALALGSDKAAGDMQGAAPVSDAQDVPGNLVH